MWKTFTSEDNNVYMLKIIEILDNYDFYLTNLTKIWSCKLSKDLIIQKFQVIRKKNIILLKMNVLYVLGM